SLDPACATSTAPLPHQTCPHHPPCLQLVDARQQAASYKSLHQRARQREDELKLQIAQLLAENRDLRHRLFGRSSEVHYTQNSLTLDDPQAEHTAAADPATLPAPTQTEPPRRPRGQQRDAPGHGRR